MAPPRPIVRPAPSRFVMPDPAEAEPGNDLIAIGADLEPGTLLAAYRSGLFPMPVASRAGDAARSLGTRPIPAGSSRSTGCT